jgi:tetratricopeptide (TPR) repeat protein
VIARAWKAFDAGRLQEAIDMLGAAVKTRPKDDARRRAYLTAMTDAGLWETVRDEYAADFDADPSGFNAYWYFMATDDMPDARAAVERARRADPKDRHTLAAAAQFEALDLLRAGKPEAARKVLIDSPLFSVDPATYFGIMDGVLTRMGDLKEVTFDDVDVASMNAPHDAGLLAQRAQADLLAGDLAGYERLLKKAATLGDFAVVHLGLAHAAALRADRELWRSELQAALDSPRDGHDWACSVTQADSALGRTWHAWYDAARARALDPGETCTLPQDLGMLMSFGMPGRALEEARAAFRRDPTDLTAVVSLARLRAGRGEVQSALRLIAAARVLAPKEPGLISAQAILLLRQGSVAEAERVMFDLPSGPNGSPQIEWAQGLVALALKRYDTAAGSFRALLDWGPPTEELWRRLAEARSGRGHHDLAARAYAHAWIYADGARRPELAASMARERRLSRERSARYPGDAAAREEWFTPVPALADCRDAAFFRDGREVVGCPWGDPHRWAGLKEDRAYGHNVWARDGRVVDFSYEGGLSEFDPAAGKSRVLFRDVEPSTATPAGRRVVAEEFWRTRDPDTLYLRVQRWGGGENARETLEALDLKTGRSRALDAGGDFMKAVYDPGSRRFYLYGGGNRELDPRTGALRRLPLMGCSLDMSVARGARTVACARGDGLELYDRIASTRAAAGTEGALPAWSPDGKTLAYVWRDRELRLLDAATGRVVAVRTDLVPDLDAPGRSWTALGRPRWSPDGRFLYYELHDQRAPDGTERAQPIFLLDLRRREVWVPDEPLYGFAWRPGARR